jgi:hypothetical protein
MPAFGGRSGLTGRRSVGANGEGPCGHDNGVAFARILVEIQAGGNILAAIDHELRGGMLELVIDARAILFRLAVEQIADGVESGEIGELVEV